MDRWKVALAGMIAGLVSMASGANADSSLPPSDPQAAVQLGVLDVVRHPLPPSQQGYFACFAHDQRIFFGNPQFNTRYYRFSIGAERSLLQVKMVETPDESLWFHLLNSQLGFIREFRGGDDQLVEYEIERGDYYLQLLTDGSMAREPDGSNHGQITFRPAPINMLVAETDPMPIGNLSNMQVTQRGTLAHLTEREFPYSFPTPPPAPSLPQSVIACPTQGTGMVDVLDIYQGDALPGRVNVNMTINLQFGGLPAGQPVGLYRWDTSQLGFGWFPIQRGSFDHPGGPFAVGVGHIGVQAFIHDYYVDYTIALRLAGGAPGPPPAPGAVKVSPLGSPPQGQCIIIGDQRIGC